MLLLGLTGSIATGKSTVSSTLSKPPYSLPVVDADKIARQVVEPGTAGYHAVVKHFGPSTPDLLKGAMNGDVNDAPHAQIGPPLNRAALGRRVFGKDNESDRKVLNSIVHPAVRREMYKQILMAYLRGNWAVVLDIPLLYESGWEALCGTILVVAVHDSELQMRRLRQRDAHLSQQDAENRVSSQWDVRDKAARCLHRGAGRGVVVWNDGDRGELESQIGTVMEQVKAQSPQWWAWWLIFSPPLAVAAASWSYISSMLIKQKWEAAHKKQL